MTAISQTTFSNVSLYEWKDLYFDWNFTEISSNVPNWQDMSVLFQLMAWHRTGSKPLLEPMLTQFTDAYTLHLGGGGGGGVELTTIWGDWSKLDIGHITFEYPMSKIRHKKCECRKCRQLAPSNVWFHSSFQTLYTRMPSGQHLATSCVNFEVMAILWKTEYQRTEEIGLLIAPPAPFTNTD